MRYNLSRLFWAFILLAVFCPAAAHANTPKFNFLLRFFDLNEAAFAYQRHCLGNTSMDPTFLHTLEFVADALFDVAKEEDPKASDAYLKSEIMDRRDKLQYALDLANMKDGCGTPDSKLAEAHYREFSRYTIADIDHFIREKTGE